MHNIMVIARREMRSYFDSPIAYIVIVAFLAVAGFMFFSSLFLVGRADMRTFFQPISPFTFFSPAMLFLILAPALTMRLIAEERRTGTLELLTTMPIRDVDVILGKFFAALGLLGVGLAMTLIYAVSVTFIGDLDWGPVLSGYLGLFLMAGALLSVGILCSTFTSNQIVAFIFSLVICAFLYFFYLLFQFFIPEFLAPLIKYMMVSDHLENMARGVIDTRDIIYYLTLTGGALFLAERSLARQHA